MDTEEETTTAGREDNIGYRSRAGFVNFFTNQGNQGWGRAASWREVVVMFLCCFAPLYVALRYLGNGWVSEHASGIAAILIVAIQTSGWMNRALERRNREPNPDDGTSTLEHEEPV